MVILDDVFSGMDAATEDMVFTRLLGPEGLLRKSNTTIVVATHAGKYLLAVASSTMLLIDFLLVNLLPSADYIVALAPNGKILEEGTFEHLNTSQGYVRSFSVEQGKRNSEISEPIGERTLGTMVKSPLADAMDEKKRQMGDISIYAYYFRSIGGISTFLFFVCSALMGFFSTFPSR